MTLIARTRRLDRPVDLLAFTATATATATETGPLLFERGATGLAGRGEAFRIPWPGGNPPAAAKEAAAALADIEVDDEVGAPGTGPVAFGALPFVPGAPAELVVPRYVAGCDEDGTRWITTITDAAEAPPDPDRLLAARADHPEPPGPEPRSYTVTSSRSPEDWCALVDQATRVLAGDGPLSKVVLAREIAVAADSPVDPGTVLHRLRAGYPGCHILAIDGLVGASPELLVSRRGDVVRSHPMAGTAPRGGDPTTDQRLAASLLASAKDRAEHQITIDMVQDTLLGWCSYVDYEAEPSVVPVANVQHLATLVEGRVFRPAPSVLELVAALHPTPAVAGWPRDEAVDWITAHEGMDRRRYAGTAGWVDAAGNGTWAVAVRCAEMDGDRVRLYAGNGIVADSDPARELAETRAKLQALLGAVVRP